MATGAGLPPCHSSVRHRCHEETIGSRVKVFVGHTSSHKLLARLEALEWGRFWCYHNTFNPFPGEEWGLDNGAFAAWQNDEAWDSAPFVDKAQRAAEMDGCVLAVLPDMVGKGEDSLDFSMEWIDQLPELPWYLAVQDGMEFQPLWGRVADAAKDPRIKGLFLGGTNQFKLTASTWRHTADMLDVKLHYGRAGTPFKVQHAMRCKVDSLDSSFPLWTHERFGIFEQAIAGTLDQMPLDLDMGGEPVASFLTNPERTEK